jgi:hypothetical protein
VHPDNSSIAEVNKPKAKSVFFIIVLLLFCPHIKQDPCPVINLMVVNKLSRYAE